MKAWFADVGCVSSHWNQWKSCVDEGGERLSAGGQRI